MERIVRDLAGPHQIPQRVLHFGREATAERGTQLRKEDRPALTKDLADALVRRALARCRCGHQRRVLGEIERHTTVARAECATTDPEDGTGCEQCVELSLLIASDARW